MGNTRLVVLVAVLALACSLCWAQRITEEQAAEAVRAFECDPNLQFWRIEVCEEEEGPEWSRHAVYTLEAGTHENPIADYCVETITGEVHCATYRLYKQHPLKEVGEPLPQEQCRQVAEDYARAKYRDFDSMGYRLQEQSLGERVWTFVWRQVLDYDAVSMNYVEVEVRAADGRIKSYGCERYPVVRPQQPSVSSQQAVQIAMRNAGITDMTETPDTALRVDPLGVTYWTVVIQGLNAEGFDVCYYVRVESQTGDVLEAERTDYGRPDDEDPDAGPPVTPPAVISPHQARDAVRAFEGNHDLVLICRELSSMCTDGPVWEAEWYYDVEDRDNHDHSWDVDAVTGEVTGFIDHSAYPEEDTDEPTGRLTAEECREFAERYVRAKFPGFDEMNFVLREPEWAQHGWSFSWREKVACEPCISSHVGADVNPEDGRIQNYGARRVPEFTPLEAKITAEQAVELARAETEIVKLYKDPDPSLVAYPQVTMWCFRIAGSDSKGRGHDYWAEVNAVTGEIIGVDESIGWGGPRLPEQTPTAGPADDQLAPIRELVAQIPGASVHWLGKDGAKVFSGTNRYALLPGSDTIEWTGGQIKLSQKMVLEGGRLMVPPELVQALVKASLSPTSPEEPSDE